MTKRFKIEPDLTCPELAGYKLPQIEHDGVGQPLTDYIKEKHNQAECIGFIDGYTKAREKFEFTENDLRQAVDLGLKLIDGNNYNLTYINNFIQSLRTPRHPIAIEVEMVQVKVNPMGRIVDPMNFAQNQSSCKWEERPATNPDGTVKGVYIYE